MQPAELERLLPHLLPVPLPLGHLLYRPGTQLHHAIFPTSAILSLHYVTESGAVAETASIGNEGVLGVTLALGGGSLPGSAAVQIAGYGFRLDESYLQKEFLRAGNFQTLLLRYTRTLLVQMAQTAVCNCHHVLKQRLCRWLLLTLDRCGPTELVITHEQVAGVLGVRRESITEAAGDLQRLGYINFRRGHIAVTDRAGLQAIACECYGVISKELRRQSCC